MDDEDANQLIADARHQLSDIDNQLFQCFYLLQHRFPVRATHTPSIDDLEI